MPEAGLVAARPRGPLWLAGLVAVSVAVRLGAGLHFGNSVEALPGVADQLSYDTLAMRVLGGHGFTFETGWWPATPAGEPTAHWSYVYVLFLAGVYGVVGHVPLVARLLQAALAGVLQPLLTRRIAAGLFGPRVGLVAAGIVAGYGYFIYYSASLMTESLCIVTLLWAVGLALEIDRAGARHPERVPLALWARLGVALSLAVLLRQAMLFVVPVILGWTAIGVFRRGAGGPGSFRRALAGVSLAVAVLAIAILPWTVRNRRVFDEWVLLNTNAGFAFFWGNHPIHGTSFVPILPGEGTYGRLIPDEVRGLNEARMDKALLGRGLAFVAAEPWRYVRLSASRVVEFIKFWPSAASGRAQQLCPRAVVWPPPSLPRRGDMDGARPTTRHRRPGCDDSRHQAAPGRGDHLLAAPRADLDARALPSARGCCPGPVRRTRPYGDMGSPPFVFRRRRGPTPQVTH